MKKYNFPKQAPFIQDRERQTDKIQERLLKTWPRCSVSVRRLCETIRTVSPGCASVPPYCMTHQANYINFLSIGFLVCKAMDPIGVGGCLPALNALPRTWNMVEPSMHLSSSIPQVLGWDITEGTVFSRVPPSGPLQCGSVLPPSGGQRAEGFEVWSDYPACGRLAEDRIHSSEGIIKHHLHFL